MIRRRIIITLLLAAACAGFVFAFTRPTDNQQPALRDAAVRHVEPTPGALVLRQTEVSIDLDAGYRGVLNVDGREIPDDQLDRIGGLNRVAFTPGDGKDIKQLAPGRHKVTAIFWPVDRTRDDAGRQFVWNFEVH
ncbi:MAG: hypothetical protein H0W70_02955 [Actinobacteria bacterium]|nr:hypothetical protein [Actinomycetota bacterium]